jgi:hypothetical protein
VTFAEALERIIDDGIAAATADYGAPRDKDRLAGSIAGFEECRNKDPIQLAKALENAQKRTRCAVMERAENYWWIRCFESEVEWVCNCASAILRNQNLPEINCPTYRGVMKAAEVIGVAEK